MLYELAYNLKVPLRVVTDEMTHEELVGWMEYFERNPIGWRDDMRFFRIMQMIGAEEKPYDIFPSLSILKPSNDMIGSLKGSLLFSKMLEAKGGDKLSL